MGGVYRLLVVVSVPWLLMVSSRIQRESVLEFALDGRKKKRKARLKERFAWCSASPSV